MQSQNIFQAVITAMGQPMPSQIPNMPNRVKVNFQTPDGIFKEYFDFIGAIQTAHIGAVVKIQKGNIDRKGNQRFLFVAVVAPAGANAHGFTPQPQPNGYAARPTSGFGAPFPSPPPSPPYVPTASAPVQKTFETPSPDLRKNMGQHIEFNADIFSFCFQIAGERMEKYSLKDEDLRAIATTLFISTSRKFNI